MTKPVSPSSTASGLPPALVTTQGKAHAMASRMTFGSPSYAEFRRNTSRAGRIRSTSSRGPRRWIRSLAGDLLFEAAIASQFNNTTNKFAGVCDNNLDNCGIYAFSFYSNSLSGTVGKADIPAGASSTTVTVHAIAGVPTRKGEKAIFNLSPGSGYTIAKPKKATIAIH